MALICSMLLAVVPVETLDGHAFEIDNFGERRATVLVFMSSRCPVTDAAIGTINEIYERNRLREVLFVGILANDAETDSEAATFRHARGVRFPVYRDRGGKAAGQLGATRTPEAFVFDTHGRQVYHGGFHSAEAAAHIGEQLDRLAARQPVSAERHAIGGTPLGDPGPAREYSDPHGQIFFESGVVFEKIPGAPAHHCSTIAEAPNGDVLCLWYGGSYESADDQVLFLARRNAGERAWSAPEVLVAGPPLQPPGNAVIFTIGDRVGVLWGRMDASRPIRRGAGWSDCQMMWRYSDDNGMTWSEDVEVPGLFGALPRNAGLGLDDGRFAVPLSGRVGGESGSFLLFTGDKGQTWTPSGVIPRGSQPTVVERSDGSLLALMRSEPFILQSESRDGGATWSAVTSTEIACPGAGIAMTRLASGTLVLVHNNSQSERTPLSVRYSTDDGANWSEALDLVSTPGEYSYPCIIQTSDGRIHVTYTYRRYTMMHVEFNEDWLYHLQRPN
jgi:predicted neuraminidase